MGLGGDGGWVMTTKLRTRSGLASFGVPR